MYYVYVLKSLKNKKRYVGSTKNLPEERLKQHNWGTNVWTKYNGLFELILREKYPTITEARKREIFLKTGVGRKFLDEIFDSRAYSSVG